MTHLTPGDPAPWFTARTPLRPDFQFGAVAGRSLVLSFIGSAGSVPGKAMLDHLLAARARFGTNGLFVVSGDSEDERQGRIVTGGDAHVFWDADARIAALYGLAAQDAVGDAAGRPGQTMASFVLDPMLRILRVVPLGDPATHARDVLEALALAPPPPSAPVLLLPRIFEPEFCRDLIALYDRGEVTDSGFMRTDPVTGMTVLQIDHRMKRRSDCLIEDEQMRQQIQVRLHRRLVPEIRKAFQFHATRIERYIVARYDAADGGHFQAHRDNTTKGTAHRRFAVTINLNAEDYEGGDLVFPEFGPQTWRAPTGGAVVFSCSLLHQAQAVTRGTRYCFLPFLYDEAAAKTREENRAFVAPAKG
jgi:predicted 2-oxoglutarate/Fe(II)-dependent dioxygenase YbiX/peroxiredoxin